MAEELEHVTVVRELGEQFAPMFTNSRDGIYLYVDEVHKICSETFARMFGLTVPEWEKMDGFVNKHVVDDDQATLIEAYQNHVHRDLTPARLHVRCLRKD